jgi:DNA-binding transcriptional MerR regulator
MIGSIVPEVATYSIGAVARMVGVPPATLRTWEERYRIVEPVRSEGGHRLYSRLDVERLRFVAGRVREGISPGDAHRMLSGVSGIFPLRAADAGRS